MSAAPADAARWRFAPALRPDQLPWYLSYSAILLFYLYASRFVPDVLLVLVAAFMLLIGGVRVNRNGTVVVLAIAAFLPLQIVLLGGRVEDPGQVLHLLYLLPLTLMLDDSRFDPGLLVRFCRATTLINVALLALLFVPPLRDLVFWGGDRGVARYQSVLPEPSFVGVYSVLNFFVLLRHGDPRWAYANLLPLGASFSFAGLAAFATLGLFFARSVWRQALLGVLIIVALMAAFFVVAPEMFAAMVANRVIEATGGGRDESVTLRIFAPLDLVRFTFQEGGLRAVLGLGLGNVEHYIYYEQAALDQHWRASGERSAQPDSVVAFVLAAFGTFGIFAMAAFAVWILLRRWSSRAYDALRPFLLVIALFTGLFISVHFWVWIYLLRQEQLFRESAAARPPTPVPGR